MLSLPADEAHIRLLRVPENMDDATERACRELLCGAERDKLSRFLAPQAAREYLLTRAFVRTTLSRYANVLPGAWRFIASQHGKPEIAAPHEYRRIRFNLSNTKGLLACAVALDREVGVDVEWLSRPLSFLDIADCYFAELERRDLHRLAESAQRERFFAYWTLKEAYGKARGVGLSLASSGCAFDVEARPIALVDADGSPGAMNEWQFGFERVAPEHVLAYAVQRREGASARVVVHEAVIW